MRQIATGICLAAFGHVLPACAQADANIEFIKRDSILGKAQSIYYDKNPYSKHYKIISSFQFGEFDRQSYSNSLHLLASKKLRLTKQPTVVPITRWVTLKQYKGKFYAYHPCDFNSHFKVSINDTSYIDWTGEGPEASKIVDQKKIDDSTYQLELAYAYNRRVIIHIIDPQKGIAVFEEWHKGGSGFYLMIAADKINSVPLIVNNCETGKWMELQFEKPNYKTLLHKK